MGIRTSLTLCVTALLVGCGGGGSDGGGAAGGGSGGGGGGGGSNYPLTVAVTPTSLKANLVQGVGAVVALQAQVTGTVSTTNTFYVVIVDSAGIIQPTKVHITPISSASGPVPVSKWLAQMVTSTTLGAGEATGSLDVRVCGDPSCANIFGTTTLPYDLNVVSPSNVTTLASLSGASDWQTEGGVASQMNYAPVTLDSSRFTVRWLQTNNGQLVPTGDLAVGPLLTDAADQLAIMMVPGTQFPNSTTVQSYGGLIAYNENDGSPAWSESLVDGSGNQQEPGSPAIANGKIYITQGPYIDAGGYQGNVSFTGLNARSGAVIFRTAVAGTNQQFGVVGDGCGPGAPVVSGDMAYLSPGCIPDASPGDGPGLPISAYDLTSGQSLWAGNVQGAKYGTTMAADGTNLYYLVPLATTQPRLTAISQATGAVLWQTDLTAGPLFGYRTPALDGSGGAIVEVDTATGPQVNRYDLASGQLSWQVTLKTPSNVSAQAMAVGNGTIFIGYQATVVALNRADGSSAWSWTAPPIDETVLSLAIVGTPVNALVATNNLLFVGTGAGVYAVDLSTHQTVWALSIPAYKMAISPSGMLYVVTSEDSSVASSAGYIPSNQALVSINLH